MLLCKMDTEEKDLRCIDKGSAAELTSAAQSPGDGGLSSPSNHNRSKQSRLAQSVVRDRCLRTRRAQAKGGIGYVTERIDPPWIADRGGGSCSGRASRCSDGRAG